MFFCVLLAMVVVLLVGATPPACVLQCAVSVGRTCASPGDLACLCNQPNDFLNCLQDICGNHYTVARLGFFGSCKQVHYPPAPDDNNEPVDDDGTGWEPAPHCDPLVNSQCAGQEVVHLREARFLHPVLLMVKTNVDRVVNGAERVAAIISPLFKHTEDGLAGGESVEDGWQEIARLPPLLPGSGDGGPPATKPKKRVALRLGDVPRPNMDVSGSNVGQPGNVVLIEDGPLTDLVSLPKTLERHSSSARGKHVVRPTIHYGISPKPSRKEMEASADEWKRQQGMDAFGKGRGAHDAARARTRNTAASNRGSTWVAKAHQAGAGRAASSSYGPN